MISKILLATAIFTAVFYSIGCCGVSCRWAGGATYEVTFSDGTTQTIKAIEQNNGDGCLNYDCELGDPKTVRLVENPQLL